MTQSPHVLVIGCGSVGKRHAANLTALGCRVSGVDPRADRLEEMKERSQFIGGHATVDAALADPSQYTAAVVASPPSAHVEQALSCLHARLPLLLEKPVSPDLASATRLLDAARRSGVPVLLGYSFRWWPPIATLRDLLTGGAIGRPLRVQMTMAAHLADWHPWERYQDFFMASTVLGGGALLDESHFLDLLLWLFEWPRTLSASVERLSDLEIDTDDNVDVSLSLPSRVRAQIHLDLYSRPHQRTIRVIGDEGTLEWDNEANEVRVLGETTDVFPFTCERNEMFVNEAKHFLDVVSGAEPECTLADGGRVLQLIEAIRESDRDGRVVTLGMPLQ